MSWDADKKYIEQLEQDNAKLQKIVDAGVELSPVKVVVQRHNYSGYVFNVLIEKNGEEKLVSKFSTSNLDVDDVISIIESIGHSVQKEKTDDAAPAITGVIDKFKKKKPILYKLLWLFLKPWTVTESVYDIILAVICNVMVLSAIAGIIFLGGMLNGGV